MPGLAFDLLLRHKCLKSQHIYILVQLISRDLCRDSEGNVAILFLANFLSYVNTHFGNFAT